jgi:cell division protein FtsZ
VATGIDHDAPATKASTQSFAFNRAAPAPAVSAPVSDIFDSGSGTDDEADEVDTVQDFSSAQEVAQDDDNAGPVIEFGAPELAEASDTPSWSQPVEEEVAQADAEDDMLELSHTDAVEEESPAATAPSAERGNALGDAAAPRIASGGGTLFERMSNLSRGRSGSTEDEDDDGDDDGAPPRLNIPRFLDRQGNK